MKIVVAEDEQICQKFIADALGTMAERVWVVDSLRGLQRELSEHAVDVIWLDLSLIDSNAECTLRHLPVIRAQAPKAVILVVSGWGSTYEKDALRLGADAYSGKTELASFAPAVVAGLLARAAMQALQRGAPANVILERVAALVGAVASDETPKEAGHVDPPPVIS